MKVLEGLGRVATGALLIMPAAFIGLILCAFTVGLRFPPTVLQWLFIGGGSATGFAIGFLAPAFALGIFSFFGSLFTGDTIGGGKF